MSESDVFDVLVIGAGPAGLALCASEKSKARRRILLVESGKPFSQRNLAVPSELACGVGGAGSAIDGKFSFFPAGTAVWQFAYTFLSAAFGEMMVTMQSYFNKGDNPQMPSEKQIIDYFFNSESFWKLKKYDSFYMEESNRFAYLQALIELARRNCSVLCNTRVVAVSRDKSSLLYAVHLSRDADKVETVYARHVVFAGGRFMPLQRLLRDVSPHDGAEKESFRRREFGVRVQLPHDNVAIREMGSCGVLDPKFVKQASAGDGNAQKQKKEIRTFCFCRNGTVCKSDIDGLQTYSGRADVKRTNFTNFGLMVRTYDESEFSDAQVAHFCRTTFELVVGEQTQDQVRCFLLERCGNEIGQFVWSGLEELFARFPALWCKELQLFGPCLEGVGSYPNVVDNLRIAGVPNAYAIGDTSGIFRGLVPSLLSGYLLAHLIDYYERDAPLFVTGNAEKASEIRASMGLIPTVSLSRRRSRLSLPKSYFLPNDLLRAAISIPTFSDCMSSDPITFATSKALLARNEYLLDKKEKEHKQKAKQLLVSCTSLEIEALNGFPGVFVAPFFERVGSQKIYELAPDSGALFTSILVVVDVETGDVAQTASGTCRGTIVKPRGANGFGWDECFQPSVQPESAKAAHAPPMTYAEMPPPAKKKISAHALAAAQLQKQLAAAAKAATENSVVAKK